MKFAALVLLLWNSQALALGAPPILTGDTRTVDAGKTEFILGGLTQSTSDIFALQIPTFEVAYGFKYRLQIRFETGVAVFFRGAQEAKVGVTNMQLGGKWRFLQVEQLSMSMHPQTSQPFALTSPDAELVPNERIDLFPIEVGYQGPQGGVVLELGIENHSVNPNSRVWGIALNYKQSKELEFLIDDFNRIRVDGSGTQAIVNLGLRYNYSETLGLIGSIGQTTQIFPGGSWTYLSQFALIFKN